MRIIRFRAWDKKENRLWSMEELGYIMFDNLLTNDLFTKYNCILMQYTGLNDINGKEIYEGDVLYWNKSKANLFWNDKECCFNIQWIDGPCFKIRRNIEQFPVNSNVMLFEVIGNIYETPNIRLLKCHNTQNY